MQFKFVNSTIHSLQKINCKYATVQNDVFFIHKSEFSIIDEQNTEIVFILPNRY